MATNAEISAAITLAQTLALTPQQMVAAIDRAIAELIYSGKPQVSYTVAGRTLMFANLATLQGLRDYYMNAQAAGATKYICQPAEF